MVSLPNSPPPLALQPVRKLWHEAEVPTSRKYFPGGTVADSVVVSVVVMLSRPSLPALAPAKSPPEIPRPLTLIAHLASTLFNTVAESLSGVTVGKTAGTETVSTEVWAISISVMNVPFTCAETSPLKLSALTPTVPDTVIVVISGPTILVAEMLFVACRQTGSALEKGRDTLVNVMSD